jgi:cytochrome c oxidase subunit II
MSAPVPGTAGWPPPVLDPAGPFAGPVTLVSWVLFSMGVAVLIIVLVALGVAVFGPRRWRERLGGPKLVWIGGLAFPVVVLSALLLYGLGLTSHLTDEPRPGELRVRVTGEMWWWRVAYLDARGQEAFQDANEIHIPAGQPVVFELDAADVIHSFWIPQLGGKKDMIPGRRNILRLQADAPGTYGGQCAEFCGGPHALMGLVVVAHTPAEFEAWRARQAAPSPAVATTGRGPEVFQSAGCGACHAVRGTAFNGQAGPDLSHVGSRRTLGAGVLPNNQGVLAGWISDSQSIKPGNRMPAYPVLASGDLTAVAAWLDSLK